VKFKKRYLAALSDRQRLDWGRAAKNSTDGNAMLLMGVLKKGRVSAEYLVNQDHFSRLKK
jgi:hypothetical protein